MGAISFSATSQVKTNSTVLCQNKKHLSVAQRVRLHRLWQSFTCLSIHCHSLLLKINLPSCPSRAKVNKYKVIASSSQEELCEPESQLQLQQEIWPLRSRADITRPVAVSQSLLFLGEITEHENYVTHGETPASTITECYKLWKWAVELGDLLTE